LLVNTESESILEPELLPEHLKAPRVTEKFSGMSLEAGREEFDRQFVLHALQKNDWNKSQTARELNITRQGLINLIQRLNLQRTR
jgi:DNA-binding NtrC family response regulator